MSRRHSDRFSKKGGKCPAIITGVLSPGSNLSWENFLLGGLIFESFIVLEEKVFGEFSDRRINSWVYIVLGELSKSIGE